MLTRLRNANSAYHDSVSMPHSKIKSHIAEILQQEGFITGWKVEDAEVGKNLVLELKFGPNRERAIAGIKRISSPVSGCTRSPPTCRRCSAAWAWRSSPTSHGLLTDKQAGKKGVGGEVLAYVW
ncbi:30S ribosomal protein S8 [Streptomyces tricolor]|nr:30S ribosomal protein S8 [Streptomyces tricolor]